MKRKVNFMVIEEKVEKNDKNNDFENKIKDTRLRLKQLQKEVKRLNIK